MGEDTKKLGKGGAVIPGKPGRKLRYGCMIGLCFALLPIAVNLMVSFLAREEFRRELAEARKKGLPTTAAEIAPPFVAEADNAAPIYLTAFPQVVQAASTEEAGFEVFQKWAVDLEREATQRGALAAYIQKNRGALDRLHEGARRPACRFDLKYGDGFSILMAHLAGLRQSTRLMRLEAKLLLVEGQEREALRAIEDLYALSGATSEEPILISLLVRAACEGVAAESLRRALQGRLTDQEALASLAGALEKGRDDGHLSRALRGERFFGVDTMERVRRDGWNSVAGAMGRSAGMGWMYTIFGWALYKDMSFYLRTMSKYAELAEQPYWQARAAEAKLEQDAQRAPAWYMMSRTILPSLAASRRSWTRRMALRDGARLAVALSRYRLARGAWPEKLDQLVPEYLPDLPLDPFTGNAFAYKTDGESARVYSLGPYGLDNGGGKTGQDDEGAILWPLGDQAPFQGK